jgi:DNA-binding NtrC family response regulator
MPPGHPAEPTAGLFPCGIEPVGEGGSSMPSPPVPVKGRTKHVDRSPVDTQPANHPLAISAEVKAGIRILVVDDERTLRESCASFLETEGYRVTVCGRGEEARNLFRNRMFDIVLLDLYMSQVTGMELLGVCLEKNPESIVIVMTGNPSVSSSVEALRAGAWDYLPKPFSATHLQILIGRAAHTVMLARESQALQYELEKQHRHSEKVTVLGGSPAFRRAIQLARKVARTDASVFITGESGTGKELFAEFIHHNSRRATRPLVAVNCAALPEPLLESEMFGHRKGAFTGAIRDKPGLLETANGGTLLLDELTEMSKPIQAKLLRVIQDGVVRRVGSETVDAVVNVRFIAATNTDPRQAVESSLLREDLFYRLHVVPIKLPALRERREDIPLLAQHFLRYYWSQHRGATAPAPTFSDAAIRALCNCAWRGNVRELQNVVEHTVVLAENDSQIRPEQIPFISGDATSVPSAAPSLDGELAEESYHAARERVIVDFELRYLTALVNRAEGNMSKAARLAGVDRTTLYRLMERHGLQRETIMVENGGEGE